MFMLKPLRWLWDAYLWLIGYKAVPEPASRIYVDPEFGLVFVDRDLLDELIAMHDRAEMARWN